MKLRNLLTSLIVVLMAAASASAVDQTMVNPSVYNAGDIAFHMPSYWHANYIEIQEFMKQYADFQCEHYSGMEQFDQIICTSVNNNLARDVIINFYFTGDHAGMTGLREAVFTIGTPEPIDSQELLEYFWLPEAFPWHRDTDWFFNDQPSLMFYTRDTAMRFDLPLFESEGDHYTTVDFWDSSETRVGVG